MTNYIANSKNRKFKKQILLFLERINLGAGRLPFSGRVILLMDFFLFCSLIFPWFRFTELGTKQIESYFAFSMYTGYIGYGILFGVVAIPFFLISHAKKERIRAHIPFRLSDTQAVVFIASMILTAVLHLLLISATFHQFTLDATVGNGLLIAISSIICMILAAYFYSRATKEQGVDIRYLGHQEPDVFSEYRDIIGPIHHRNQDEKDKNMTLPI